MREVILEAKTEKLDELLGIINFELEKNDCPLKTQIQIDVAAEEIFVNIAHYAYGGGQGFVTVKIDASGTTVSITFIDGGIPYNPLDKPDPDVNMSADERKIGGLGIYMVKKSMDEVTYEYKDGNNVLSLRKNY